jgi:hypothetical protein
MLRAEKSCPLPKTHNRLRQAHDLWHEIGGVYPDVDEFVIKLNACVQAVRSVTWVLQKELSRQEWFKDWYASWQATMRADVRMKWLVNARNAIEKEGDLDTRSIARVSIAATDGEQVLANMEVPPLLGPAEVAEIVKLPELPDALRKHAVMVVERRWTVTEFPDDELLDVLAHCYGVLASIVREAHERCGVQMHTFGGETHADQHERLPHPSGRLPCMVTTQEMRSAYWHLGQDALIQYGRTDLTRTREQLEAFGPEAAKHYGNLLQHHRLAPGMPLSERASVMHEWGKHMLRIDGFHHSFAWTFLGDSGRAQVHAMDSQDQQDKIMKVRLLAGDIEESGADGLIFTGETWHAQEVASDDPRFDLRAGEREDRLEGLVTYALARGGPYHAFFTPFSRSDADEIVLADTTMSEYDHIPIFDAVHRVWVKWGETSS